MTDATPPPAPPLVTPSGAVAADAPTVPASPGDTGTVLRDIGPVIEQVTSNNSAFANTIHNYDHCSIGADSTRIEDLSSQHFMTCDTLGLDRLLISAAFKPEEVRQIEAILNQNRLAVICGEPDVGKGTLARLVAARLRGEVNPPHPVAESSPLGAEVRAPLLHLARQAKSLGPGVWLFRDFLASDHRDLLRFIEELNDVTLGPLSAHLRATRAFLLFTTDSARLHAAQSRLASLGVLHQTSGPELESVLVLLRDRAEQLVQPPRAAEEERQKTLALVTDHGKRIVAALRTPPRVVRFLDRYLFDVALARVALEEALFRVDDLGGWLLRDLSADLDTWSYALALVLSQPNPPYVGAPWLQVHELARAITRHLRPLLRPQRGSGMVISDERRLERLQAEVRRNPFPGTDLARFRDDSYPEKLWQVLLGSGREVLSLLLPLLRSLAEGETGGGFAMRAAAARALGRAGEMDARSITFPLISIWSRSEAQVRHLALGQLFQGVLGSPVESFRQASLGQLSRMLREATGAEAWAPAVALREIGCVDLDLAIAGLVRLARASFDEDGLHLGGAQREALRLTEDMLRASHSKENTNASKSDLEAGFRQLLTPALCDFKRAPQEILAAVQYALVGLCFFYGPLPVLQQLADHLSVADDSHLQPLLALLVLRQDGVLDVLERFPLTLSPAPSIGTSTEIVASRFLVAAATELQGPKALAEFLILSYRQASTFPGVFARALRSRLLGLLRDWSQEIAKAASFEELWNAGRSLLSALLRGSVPEFREEVFALLHDDPEFTALGSRLARLATEALTSPPG